VYILLLWQVSSLPQDLDALAQMCCTALSGGTERHLVLIVDAVNQVRYFLHWHMFGLMYFNVGYIQQVKYGGGGGW